MSSIEEIILRNDGRGMRHLAPHLPADYASEAAQLILDHPGRAMIATGFYILSAGKPETDGPPGAVAIGRALAMLGYDVSYVTDRHSMEALGAIAEPEHKIVEFPIGGHRESADFANGVIESERPDVLVSIERCGISADGIYRNMRGLDISEFNAKIDHLFEQHPYSVGIGDGGNEIGMGNLQKVVEDTDGLPDMPCITTTTKLMCASVSNWGGYGLVTALSLAAGQNLLPSVAQENEWIQRCYEAGAVEGMTGEWKPWVDGFPPEKNSECLAALQELIGAAGL